MSTTHLEGPFYFCYFLYKNFVLKPENFLASSQLHFHSLLFDPLILPSAFPLP